MYLSWGFRRGGRSRGMEDRVRLPPTSGFGSIGTELELENEEGK